VCLCVCVCVCVCVCSREEALRLRRNKLALEKSLQQLRESSVVRLKQFEAEVRVRVHVRKDGRLWRREAQVFWMC
jgi:hypothetical protein